MNPRRLLPRPGRAVALAVAACGTAVALFLVGAVTVTEGGGGQRDSSALPTRATGVLVDQTARGGKLDAVIRRAQQRLHEDPKDARTWARLGFAYVQQARVTADPSYYPKAEGALRRSLELSSGNNYQAMVGMAALANARHRFGKAVEWGQRAKAINSYSVNVYGVLADAYTQLGKYEKATAAVQRMLDLDPGLAALTRASYELQIHGRNQDARKLLHEALEDANTPAAKGFCRYYLGELAFNSGHFDEAARQFELGFAVAPSYTRLLAGKAKVEAAQGKTQKALRHYRTVVRRLPLPEYIISYGELLLSEGKKHTAREQWKLLAAEQRLFAAAGVRGDVTWTHFEARHGDAAKALSHAKDAWQRRHSVVTADAMAWALHVSGKDEQALRYAKKATRLGWENARFYYHRGMIERAVGRHDAARRHLSRALQINPKFSPLSAPRAKEALAALGGSV